MAKGKGGLGQLSNTEYADQLKMLRTRVGDLAEDQKAIRVFLEQQDRAAQKLSHIDQRLHHHVDAIKRQRDQLKALGKQMDAIVRRPAPVARQRRSVRWSFAGGFAVGILLMTVGLVLLPDRAGAAVAKWMMGKSYWDAAWVMLNAHDPHEHKRFGLLSWIQTGDGQLEALTACRDQAQATGQPQRCTVVFRP